MEVSKMVVDREKSSTKVVAAARTHAPKAGAGMAAFLGEEYGPPTEKLMKASAGKLEKSTATMVAADEAHIAELDDDAAFRTERDKSAKDIRVTCMDLRELTTTMFGAEYCKAIGYEGNTPEDPLMLHRLATRIVDRIEKVDMPKPRFEGMTFDPTSWKKRLQAPADKLGTVLKKTATEDREAEQTIGAKDDAMTAYDDVFSKTAGLVSALLRIAGEEDLAQRVRPVKSRPGRISEPDAGDTLP